MRTPLQRFCETMKCRLCDQYPTTPKTLCCLHTFCEKCLVEYVETLADDDQKQSLPCPACGLAQTPKLERAAAADVATNFCFQNLLHYAKKDRETTSGQRKVQCGRCRRKTRPVDTFCTACGLDLCDLCAEDHGVAEQYADHNLTPKDGSTTQHGRWSCHKHKDEPMQPSVLKVDYYCEQCRMVMCLVCRLTEHTGHPTRTALEADRNQGHRDCIKHESDETQRVAKLFTDSMEDVEALKRDLATNRDNVEVAIDEKTAALHEALDEEMRRLKQTTRNTFDRKIATCNKQIQDLDEIHEKFGHTLSITQGTLEVGQPEDVLFLKERLVSRLASLRREYCNYDHTPRENDVINFAENNQTTFEGVIGTVFSPELYIPGLGARFVDPQFYADRI